MSFNCLIVLGPTAVGKTAIGVRLAAAICGEVVSADSRQVYRGLDIGSGKDLNEYTLPCSEVKQIPERAICSSADSVVHVPYHLIDIADVADEYNVFDYQQDFYKVFAELQKRKVIPVIVGGTGMYLDAVVRSYNMMPVPENTTFRSWCTDKTTEELADLLLTQKKNIHNVSDLKSRERIIRAIEIYQYMNSPECAAEQAKLAPRPKIQPFIIGTTLERSLLRQRIAARLKERMDNGMIEEVQRIHESGIAWDRLERLGLEYRFVSEYLQAKIESKTELFFRLNLAIGQFAKRQETWFRGMEKKGVHINWLPSVPDAALRLDAAFSLLSKSGIL